MTKEQYFGAPCRVLICLLTISFRKRHICIFCDYISFNYFLATSICFLKLRLISLNFELNICCLKLLGWNCAANQYREIVRIFSKIENTVRGLRVNETKLTAGNAFTVDLFASGDETWKKIKIWKKNKRSFGASGGILTCLLTLGVQRVVLGRCQMFLLFNLI